MTIKAKKSKINLREKLAELLNFRQIRDRLDGLGLYLGKDRTGTAENLAVRGGASIDDLQLAEISAAVGGTAVDVFVYDTRNDSDGGKWRERTSHTSWYNEELNTATRGGRREFPAVAVIVAESNKVTIYDGDDPDLSMWMVFEDNSTTGFIGWGSTVICVNEAVSALNSQLVYGGANGLGGGIIDFAKDDMRCVYDNPWTVALRTIVDRNETTTIISGGDGVVIINNKIHDVAMTVLPNAPIDSETGLPVPTIAVATDGGVSVIRDDGNVVDLYRSSGDEYCYTIAFDSNNSLFVSWGVTNSTRRHVSYWDVMPNSDDTEMTDNYYSSIKNRGGSFAGDGGLGNVKISNHARAFASTDNFEKLTLLDHNYSDTSKSQFCDITSTYNTGWMPGDVKLATLSDTKIEKVGVDESINTNLITNGEFDGETTGWTESNAILSVNASNQLVIADNGDYSSAYQSINTIVGRKYILTFDNASGSNSLYVRIFNDTFKSQSTGDVYHSPAPYNSSANGLKVEFTAESETTVIAFAGGGTTDAIVDNISVKQTGELITNGTFDNGIKGWISANSAVLSSPNNDLKIDKDGVTYFGARQEFTTVVGKKYTVSYDLNDSDSINGSSGAYFQVRGIDTPGGSLVYDVFYPSGAGTFSVDFIAESSTSEVRAAMGSTGTYAIWDNISVRLAEDDRSVNNNGLQVFGEITKSPVAPGADLVAYSGFSAENYLMQPYNSDLDFGTGDFCVMGWVKQPATAIYAYLFHRRIKDSSGPSIDISVLDTGAYRFYISDGTSSTYMDSSTQPTDTWQFVSFIRRSGLLEIHVNNSGNIGTYVGSQQNRNVDAIGASVWLGVERGSFDQIKTFTGGSMALWRISATALTAEQIAKIYRDEKVLFQDGAQATLYGTSDAVTALAYDNKTELLHVGTSSGRSDFSGLRRINNTTTAVTTSISASNNLIAEQ